MVAVSPQRSFENKERTLSWSVLVVDDEPEIRNLFHLMLDFSGFRVFEAEDGIDALAKVEEIRPDVIILDVMMPNMDGLEACRALRRKPLTTKIPIVMVSGKTRVEDEEAGMAAGATLYLRKPVGREELIQALHHALGVVPSNSSP